MSIKKYAVWFGVALVAYSFYHHKGSNSSSGAQSSNSSQNQSTTVADTSAPVVPAAPAPVPESNYNIPDQFIGTWAAETGQYAMDCSNPTIKITQSAVYLFLAPQGNQTGATSQRLALTDAEASGDGQNLTLRISPGSPIQVLNFQENQDSTISNMGLLDWNGQPAGRFGVLSRCPDAN
ncbi:hypothetical protein [Acidocella sp.]|uniref:hypothetical protein n=1 Tax=Acidocella sp. TaxID=50710 RepID=UPI002F4128A9